MANTVSDFILDRLSDWEIRRIYGYPGDGINGLMGAMDRASDRFQFIRVTHEEMAAFMACAHAKFTGEAGVCMATSGPGAVHLLNGLYDAKMDHQPVVAIVGQQKLMALGGSYQQEVDLISLYKDVASYCHMICTPESAQHIIDRAIRIARAERTVTCVIVPNDVQEMDAVDKAPHVHGSIHSSAGYSQPRIVPKDDELLRAAEVLNSGERVAMLIGAGALRTRRSFGRSRYSGAGVAKALLGKAALPDDLPFVTGAIGLLGTEPSWKLMSDCDTLFMVGSSFPYSEFLPKEGQARGVQIDIEARMLGIRYPMEVNLHGDSKETLRALIPYLNRKENRAWREEIEAGIQEWWETIAERAMNEANPINPQRVFWELSSRLPDNCIISSDSGSSANWFARYLKIRPGMMASLSGNLATMCPGVPYAIAAKFAFPERVSVAAVGDGAMQMLGNNGLVTISRYWREWEDPRLIILVLNNHDLNQVTWEMRVMAGNPKYETSQYVPEFPYANYAESLGLRGIKVDTPDQIVPAWEAAFAADRPVVVEAMTDPEVPTLPPHITFKQARYFLSSILKGDPHRGRMMKNAFKETWDSLVH